MGMCVVEKIAALMCGCEVLPCTGAESWTRDDDALWGVVTRVDDEDVGMCEDDAAEERQDLPRSSSGSKDEVEDRVQALHRRDNMDIMMHPKEKRVWAWLDNISSMYSPRIVLPSPIATSSKTEINGGPISPLDINNTAMRPICPFCNTDWQTMKDFEKAEHMLSHSHMELKHATTAASRIDAMGVGVKRRHSFLSVRTLRSYHVNQGKGKMMLKADSAASLLEHWTNFGGEDSPFTGEYRRAKQGRALERRGSAVWDQDGEEEDVREWFGDDEEEDKRLGSRTKRVSQAGGERHRFV
ncbi:hypothetical protein BU25DRAFT_463774 [Macroventuria anomochaeta]|uniref:Uncharacterized protein n=1 Tax=Macroventuria anomochaeta TaxID=301207 RepID=A0ACB6RJX3_9PLEO|nr:uncharacterized protein BU25DRAFT_463774 [Macroventuria anomochaeta]KAF2621277.1 hypothetical protein BU25DRAFT_463774 [Macroventuria anomochaeta]